VTYPPLALKEGLVDKELLRGLKPDGIFILNRGEN
jgi:hypothetical protein